MAVERSTGKEPLSDEDVSALLQSADRVVFARGRSRREVTTAEVELSDLKGPTGNYRAPMVLANRTLIVGLSTETLTGLLAD